MSTTTDRRVDHDWIVRNIPPQARLRVLDLGCGDGTLLDRLERENGVKAIGIDFAPEFVQICIEKGLSAIQADIDEGLQDYPDGAFDYVILCRTFHLVKQPIFVLAESLRVGNHVIISFENEAYWRKRLSFLVRGDLPADHGDRVIPEVTRVRNFL
ncbi:MAG TPA: methionine biosynthesis protein MetW, partial [Candidatus Lokiarchaeia archaeon]|nr:methionine biosynthesis protein MetW [Candidatus Lokiarchaeia archaeon]